MSAFRPSRLPAVAAVAVLAAAIAPTTALGAAPIRVSAKPIAATLSKRPTKTTIVVKNTGKRRVAGLALKVTAPKGVKVALAGAKRGTRKLKPLKAGKSARVRVTLRASGKRVKRGRLVVKVTRKGKTGARARVAFGAGGAQ